MGFEKECRPKPGVASSIAGGQKGENGWRFNRNLFRVVFPIMDFERKLAAADKGSVVKAYSFTKADRIRESGEYQALAKAGTRVHSQYFVLVYRKSRYPQVRLGLTVSKKVGKAVNRNRVKRIVREYFRLNRNVFPVGLDVNVIARQRIGRLAAEAIRDHLGSCLARIAEKTGKRDDD
jgi:ribonuclease P protein component